MEKEFKMNLRTKSLSDSKLDMKLDAKLDSKLAETLNLGNEGAHSSNLAQRLIEKSQSTPDKNVYEFSIGSIPFKLRSNLEPMMVQELVEMVDLRIQKAVSALKSGSFQSAAVLAALNLAEELVILKKQALKELDFLENETKKVTVEIDYLRQNQSK
jgi:cell division protein ZapA